MKLSRFEQRRLFAEIMRLLGKSEAVLRSIHERENGAKEQQKAA